MGGRWFLEIDLGVKCGFFGGPNLWVGEDIQEMEKAASKNGDHRRRNGG